jgi:sulfate adenylyltransferase
MAKQVPHGGELVNLMLEGDEEKSAAIAKCTAELQLTPRQLCDVELICNGGFSPLTGFMDQEAYESVVEKMELPDGLIFGLPVVFDTDSEDLQSGMTVLLKDGENPIATVEFTDKFIHNKPLK